MSPTQNYSTKNEVRQKEVIGHFILVELDRNRDKSRVFSRLHGDGVLNP